jgi:hypothetical protein
MRKIDSGRWVLSGVAAFTAAGGVLADWNRTHLFNPEWTPHSKFHDAWTILLGVGMGGSALYLLWRRHAEPGLAAALLAQFWGAQAASYAFPNAAGIAREFPDPAARPGLTKLPEGAASALMLTLTGAGYALERCCTRRV